MTITVTAHSAGFHHDSIARQHWREAERRARDATRFLKFCRRLGRLYGGISDRRTKGVGRSAGESKKNAEGLAILFALVAHARRVAQATVSCVRQPIDGGRGHNGSRVTSAATNTPARTAEIFSVAVTVPVASVACSVRKLGAYETPPPNTSGDLNRPMTR